MGPAQGLSCRGAVSNPTVDGCEWILLMKFNKSS